jgi:hypothetical protein
VIETRIFDHTAIVALRLWRIVFLASTATRGERSSIGPRGGDAAGRVDGESTSGRLLAALSSTM